WFYGTTSSYVGGGIFASGGNTKLLNCVVVGNAATKKGGGIWCSHGNYQIINCTVSGNRTGAWGYGGGILFSFSDGTNTSLLKNSIIWQNRAERAGNEIMFSSGIPPSMLVHTTNSLIGEEPNDIVMAIGYVYDTLSGQWLTGNPVFSGTGYWDPNGTLEDLSDDFWVDGDYHLKSQAGRYDPNTQSWVQDDVTSPCIDTGDPNSPIGLEPFPNGGYINMGAYSGTSEASKSYFDKPVCETIVAGDINGDCKVDILDLEIMLLHWLEEH
ncbi:MAG: hypothetical protein JXA96_18275, partial [Sedimentisphaerales bacterium]|nr:hypothetical protein [Sedimentisphaerales bacterium]